MRSKNKDLGRPLSRAVTVFFFSAFLLLFLRDFQWQGLALAFAVPMLNVLTTGLLPRLFPSDKLLLSLTNAVGAGRMRQAARELVKAYIHGVESAALDDVFELLAWNQGIGFFSSEIGPSALFQAYKLIKNGEKQGKSREDICSALREKFGEKNPEMQVLNR